MKAVIENYIKEEVYIKYKDLEQIAVKDLFVKYVPLKAD